MKLQPAQQWILPTALALLTACGSSSTPGPTPTLDAGTQPDAGILLDAGTQPKPVPFTLGVSSEKIPIRQGSTATFKVTVTRESGFDGAVALSLRGLPLRVTASSPTVASGAAEADIQLDAESSGLSSLPTLVTVTGTSGEHTFSKTITVTVRGRAGAVDSTFSGGAPLTDIGMGDDVAHAMAVQADGKIVVAGTSVTLAGTDFAVARFKRDGILDQDFNASGTVMTSINAGTDEAYAVAIQGDGKILVAGSTDEGAAGQHFALVRYNSNGSLDTGFGTGGKVTTSFGSGPDRAYAIAIQADGKIVLGGEASSTTTGLDFALARYNTDGSLDTSFGTSGKVLTSIKDATGTDSIAALVLQPVGGETRIVAAGGDGDFALARYDTDGSLDTSFGTAGKIFGLFGSTSGSAYAAVLAPDGKLVVAGHSNNDFALVRLSETGLLDPSFGSAGKVVTQSNMSNVDIAAALALQSDGKIVAGGWVNAGSSTAGNFVVARYDETGVLDSTFGSGGKVVVSVVPSGQSNRAHALALQPDDRVPVVRILLAGEANMSHGGSFNYDFALVRYWP